MWSPWRSVHINQTVRADRNETKGESIFSSIAKQQNDRENLILWRGDTVFVVMNLYPYNNGHLLIVPYREVARYEDLTDAEMIELARTIDRCLRCVQAALDPDGVNVGMNLGKAAGAGIPGHLHMHVVPRWHGDTNFMPALAETKVIPEALRDTYTKLHEVMKAL